VGAGREKGAQALARTIRRIGGRYAARVEAERPRFGPQRA